MFDSQTLWCEAASAMSLACGEREGGWGGVGGEQWFTRGPSILSVTMGQRRVWLVSLMCVTLA